VSVYQELDEAVLVCGECGRTSSDGAPGWRAYLDIDGETVTSCPECAELVFGE